MEKYILNGAPSTNRPTLCVCATENYILQITQTIVRSKKESNFTDSHIYQETVFLKI